MKKNQNSWALYDWANSAYATSVIAGFFPAFFQQYWSDGTDPSLTTARLGILSSVAGLTVALLAPFLGALADVYQKKKLFLAFFLAIGTSGTALLYFVQPGQWEWAAGIYAISFIGFYGANSLYDSLLPSAAGNDSPEYVSSRGYSLGYLGGGILLAFQVLAMNIFADQGVDFIVRVSFVVTALWWLVFSIPLFIWVKEPRVSKAAQYFSQAFAESLKELGITFREISKERKELLWFLAAYWLYIDGVYTVVGMAVNFGITLGFETSDLIAALLITQFVGFPSAWLFGKLSLTKNPTKLILMCIAVYCLVTLWALWMENVVEFYILAAVIGTVQGGIQALSRGLFSRHVPLERSAQYFGLFNLVGKFAAVLGPALVGLGAYFLGSTRFGLICLLALFIPGAILLWSSGIASPKRGNEI